MSPISERELAEHMLHDGVITDDRACRHCGYNLRGLPLAGTCPECGQKIKRKRRGLRRTGIDHAPLPFLRSLRLGAGLTTVSATVGTIASVATLPVSPLAAPGMAAIASLWWFVGVFFMTQPIPLRDLDGTELAIGWKRWGRIARATQGAWLLACIAWLFMAGASGTTVLVFKGIVIGALAVGYAGGLAFTWHLSNLADWAQDPKLGDWLRATTWGLALGGIGSVLFTTVGSAAGGLFGIILFLGSSLIGFIYIASVIWFLVCLVFTERMCRWAVHNARHRIKRDDVLRSKAADAPLPAPRGFEEPLDPGSSPRPGKRTPTLDRPSGGASPYRVD